MIPSVQVILRFLAVRMLMGWFFLRNNSADPGLICILCSCIAL
jgi:hypothetical protein